MKLNIYSKFNHLSVRANQLLKRMLGPLCGIDHEIGFMLPASRDSRVIVAGAELTGLHTLLNLPHPGRGAYHLGGCGLKLNEAVIRTLGETIERYAQVISEKSGFALEKFSSYQDMIYGAEKVISLEKINYFLTQQYYQPNFPFDLYTSDQALTWIKLNSLLSRESLWVPAQLALVGYRIKRNQGEPWIASAVTTGTAAHTNRYQALINSVMELIQVDSAMGHWYSHRVAPRIELDERVQAMITIMEKYSVYQKQNYSFHWLKNPDLPGFSIACVYRDFNGSIPKVSVGLGASLKLSEAMYKAFLEAAGVKGLARMAIFDKQLHSNPDGINPHAIYDLDTNVAYYALGNQFQLIEKKFPSDKVIKASEMPVDISRSPSDVIHFLLNSFSENHKELLFYDLTNSEASQLGFTVSRVWSPDLLPLCLPSAPFLNHPRFITYGGAQHDFPHPYP